ncbi:MAG: hypothetical protein HZA90_05025 [Verrucomicrobia bacterium]|nr:hypothetical protein [Verrucomicrobiota bacterium]
MRESIVITGVGVVTPLGKDPREVLRRVEAGESAAAPSGFGAGMFACPVCARVKDFDAREYVAEAKMVRLMNRDAQLAVAAARLALRDAGLQVGQDYASEDIGLFGATGLVGLPLGEVLPLIKASVGADGGFDPRSFGEAGLRAVSPILSFKILSNMPVCFVSICENIQGPNAIYTPWEGQGAQAIEAGLHALEGGDARCALVGGCDVKTHELAFIGLEQQGIFESWRASPSPPSGERAGVRGHSDHSCERRAGVVPGEGAGFLVLEKEADAAARGARIYARVAGFNLGTRRKEQGRAGAFAEVLKGMGDWPIPLRDLRASAVQSQADETAEARRSQRTRLVAAIVAASNGDPVAERDEERALFSLGIAADTVIHPKKHAGDLFAAAAALQVGLAAVLAERCGGRVLANCFGHGSEQAAFLLEKP